MLRALFQASRPLAHANIAPPLLFGQALAFATSGAFSWRALALAQLFGVLDHLYIVLANDYADRDADARNEGATPFSGGSRVLPDGLLSPRLVLGLAIAAAVALVTLSLLFARERPLLPALAGIAVLLLWAYSFRPLALSYRGGGEWLQALGVGLVLPLVGFHAQEPSLAAIPWLAFAPTVVLGLAGNLLTALPDARADAAAGKLTWVVRRGVPRAARDLLALTGLAIALGALVLPFASQGARVAASALPLLVLGAALPLRPRAASGAGRRELLVFVLAAATAGTGAIVSWAVALFAG